MTTRKPFRWALTAAVSTFLATSVTAQLSLRALPPAVADTPASWVIPAAQDQPVPLSQAGEVIVWGDNDKGQTVIPASLQGVAVTQVVDAAGVMLALTASGKVVSWGENARGLAAVPAGVNQVGAVQIAASGKWAGAVLRDGTVRVWGARSGAGDATQVPAGLDDVRQLALTASVAVALKSDGRVVAWGEDLYATLPPPDGYSLATVPEGLRASSIAAAAVHVTAVTVDGTVVAWGNTTSAGNKGLLALPSEVTQAGNVTAVSLGGDAAVAMLADGSTARWGNTYRQPSGSLRSSSWLPPSMEGRQIQAFDVSYTGANMMAVDEQGALHYWVLSRAASSIQDLDQPSEQLTGRYIAQFAASASPAVVVTKLLPAIGAQVRGAVVAGRTVTGVPATFSASPTSVTSQWVIDGVPSGNTSATLHLGGMQGKTIAYVSTASKVGEETVTSSSTPVRVAAAPTPPTVAKVSSRLNLGKVKVAKKGVSVTVAGRVTAAKPPTGAVTLTIAKGPKRVVTRTVRVGPNGSFSLKVTKFTKVALKVIKGKSKKRYRGTYTLKADFGGNQQVKASSAATRFKVK